MGLSDEQRRDFQVNIKQADIEKIAMLPVQIPLVASGLTQEGLNTYIRIRQLETYLQDHACIPDFVVVMDE